MKIVVITQEKPRENEAKICNQMFRKGLEILHLRKPGADRGEYENIIKQIEREYRNRIMINEYYELIKTYGLKGAHLRFSELNNYVKQRNETIAVSCHSITEVLLCQNKADYVYLSPIFDSISKKDYKSNLESIKTDLQLIKTISLPVFALGGVSADKLQICKKLGFKGVVYLGHIWQNI